MSVFLVLLLSIILITCGSRRGSVSQLSPTIYLQAVTSNSVYVMAESPSTVPLRVDYKSSNANGNSVFTESTLPTTAGTYIHRIHLNGLKPDTTYYYRLGSHRAHFKTAAYSGTNFRFAFMGDSRTGNAVHDAIAQLILTANPRFSLYGGDLCMDGDSYSSYKEEFFRPNQLKLAASVPFFNTTGNHERWKTNTKAFMLAPVSNSGKQSYYSFDYGDLHVVVMNHMDPDGYKIGSPQYNFIINDLKATTKPWKIVMNHAPAYASGGHGENTDMIALTKNVFEPCGVNLVLSGHSHFYQRNFVNGIYHLIIGSSGTPLSNPGPVGGYTQVSLKSYCWAIFDLKPTSMKIHVYDEKGTEIDSLTLSQHAKHDKSKYSTASHALNPQKSLIMVMAMLTSLHRYH
ncbi:MAG: metallophosphoesterase family protein [Smithella sp.]